MVITMNISEARKKLMNLSRQIKRKKEPDTIAITRRGQPTLALLPWDLYESIIETLEILNDKKLMVSIRRGIRDIERGKTYKTKEVKETLDLE
jgi:PHD/YefM family antitoxin component YafN of YafNO toxin-antitoxin module